MTTGVQYKAITKTAYYLKGKKFCKVADSLGMDGELFITAVEQAVSLSLSSHKSLVVYNGREKDDKEWLEKWLTDNGSLSLLRNKAVWLRLRPGSEQFQYFEQLFPSVAVPSVYVIRQGKIVAIISGSQANVKQLADALKVSLDDNAIGVSAKSFKDRVVETTQRKRLEEVKKQRQMAKEERERILQLVKADRAERKAMESSDLASREASDKVRDNIKDFNMLHSKTCDLMVRLTDSSTLTGHFDAKETLNDVRKWVDEHRTDSDCLYAFHRNIPRVTFTDSEELKNLEELQLLPRSVLILKPLENSHTNVAEAKGPGLLGKVFTGLSTLFSRSSGEDNNDAGKNYSNTSGATISCLTTRDSRRSENLEERDTISHSGMESSPRVSLSNSEEVTVDSPASSRFESPASHAADHHPPSASSPSDLNLPSRSVTPNVHQFINKDDDEKEKSTYNGNTINLEKKKDDD